MSDQENYESFQNEALEVLEELISRAVNIEGEKGFPEKDRENFLRSLHSLKGAASVITHQSFVKVAHLLESILQHPSLQEFVQEKEFFNILLKTLDILMDLVGKDPTAGADQDIQEILQELSQYTERFYLSSSEKIKEALPGLTDSIFEFLTEDQEQILLDLCNQEKALYSLEVAFDIEDFLNQSQEFLEKSSSLGEIVSCTSTGFSPANQPIFVYILSSDLSLENLKSSFQNFSATVLDLRVGLEESGERSSDASMEGDTGNREEDAEKEWMDPHQRILKTLPGLPQDLLDSINQKQEKLLLGLSLEVAYYLISVAFDVEEFLESSQEFLSLLFDLGEVVLCMSSGFNENSQPIFTYVLSSDLPLEKLQGQMEKFSAQVFDLKEKGPSQPSSPIEPQGKTAPPESPPKKEKASQEKKKISPTPPVSEKKEKSPSKKTELSEGMRELQDVYIAEFPELIDTINTLVENLGKNKEDRQLIDEIFRFGHSLKGSAGTCGFPVLSEIASPFEDVLSMIRGGKLPVTDHLCDLCYEWIDALEEIMEVYKKNRFYEGNIPGLIIGRLRGYIQNPQGSPSLSTGPEKSEEPTQKASGKKEVVSRENIRVSLHKIDSIINTSGELVNMKSNFNHFEQDLRMAVAEAKSSLKKWSEKYSRLQNLAEFKGFFENEKIQDLLQYSEGSLKKSLEGLLELFEESEKQNSTLSLLIDRISEESIKIRMLPLKSLFQKFPRLVRDTARMLEREVDIEIQGEDTEIDKMMLEELNDPLVHMLRNCVDHGIDSPEIREKKRKSRKGKVLLKAYHEENRVVIEISDDGAGMSVEKISQKGISAGIVNEDRLKDMSKSEILSLIFAPGFSTKTEVTQISGRGVGMDVVQTNINKLQGQIEIHSEEGKGSRFRLKLPLTLSIIQGLVIREGKALYCLPSLSVVELIQVIVKDLNPLGKGFAMTYRDEVLPVIPLGSILGISEGLPPTAKISLIVLSSGQRKIGLAIREVLAQEEMVIKPLGSIMKHVKNVSGVTIRARGELAVVLDGASLIQNASLITEPDGLPSPSLREEFSESSKKIPRKILLAEDSLTTREMIANLLELEGYQVEGVSNGEEAWSKLQKGLFHMVISDIDMPFLNGLELTKKIRSSSEFFLIPVVIITSLGSDEEKRKGLQAGADAYISKREFHKDILLDRIKELIQ